MEIDTFEYVIARLSVEKYANLVDFIGNISHYMCALIKTSDHVTLIIKSNGWKRIEFDYDEGETKTGYRMISIDSLKTEGKENIITKLTSEMTRIPVEPVIVSSYDKYLILVPQEHLEAAVDILRKILAEKKK